MNIRDTLRELAGDDNRERRSGVSPKPLIRLWTGEDKLRVWAPAGDASAWSMTDLDLEHGTATLTLPYSENWVELFYRKPRYLSRLVTFDYPGGYRAAYFVTSFKRKREGLTRRIEVTCVHISAYLSHVYLWPDPLMPPEFQPSGAYRYLGPACTGLKAALTKNLVRLQAETWALPVNNPFDPANWGLLNSALNPIVVNPRRVGLLDTSSWITADWAMESWWDAAVEVCRANDLSIKVDLWLPGDEQPFPEWLVLRDPRIIVDVVPTARQVNFTGTVVDGVIRDILHLAEDAWNWIAYPILDPAVSVLDGLAVNQRQRLPFFRAGDWSPVGTSDETTTLPASSRSTFGGKSPDWLNSLIGTGVAAGVGAIGAAVGIPGLKVGFLEKAAQNKLFAYHSVEDLALAREAGRWRFRESFAGSQTTALSLQALEAAKADRAKNRGRVSHSATITNGAPYMLGVHLVKGQPVAMELEDGTVGVDTLTGVTVTGGRGQTTVALTVAQPEELDPGVYALKKIRDTAGWLNRLAIQG